jgi:hypothetical protein
MRHTITALGLALALALPLAAPAQANLLRNGGFEAGNQGFSSGHAHVAPCAQPGKSCGLWGEGSYAIGSDPRAYHPYFDGAPQAGGAFLMVNGAPVAGSEVWAQRGIAVIPGGSYVFSAWVASLVAPAPAELVFAINGVALGAAFVPAGRPGEWSRFEAVWEAGTARWADVTISNGSAERVGNDFGLDELSFSALPGADAAEVPGPASLGLFGLAVLGVGLVRRRRG